MIEEPEQKMNTVDWMGSESQAQNALHGILTRYINGAIFSRSDVMLSLFSPVTVIRRRSGRVLRAYHTYRESLRDTAQPRLNIEVEAYQGNNPHVATMQEYLDRHLSRDIIGAYVHGSLGTYEEAAYSDFDALVILKADVFESTERLVRVADRLRDATTIMYRFDPLQHHGWFVMTEDDLSFYCEAYFPVELFRYAKSLFDEKGRQLSVVIRGSQCEIVDTLKTVAASVIAKINQGRLPKNLYQLKCLTSEFMLLPALYLQSKTGAGVFKKTSFEQARSDFTPESWKIMDQVSALRMNWRCRIPPLQRRMLTLPNALRSIWALKFSPPIPNHIFRELTPGFYADMVRLAEEMMCRANECGKTPPKH